MMKMKKELVKMKWMEVNKKIQSTKNQQNRKRDLNRKMEVLKRKRRRVK
jgi:hypothetical protein